MFAERYFEAISKDANSHEDTKALRFHQVIKLRLIALCVSWGLGDLVAIL
jgi:hypothetical protein